MIRYLVTFFAVLSISLPALAVQEFAPPLAPQVSEYNQAWVRNRIPELYYLLAHYLRVGIEELQQAME